MPAEYGDFDNPLDVSRAVKAQLSDARWTIEEIEQARELARQHAESVLETVRKWTREYDMTLRYWSMLEHRRVQILGKGRVVSDDQ